MADTPREERPDRSDENAKLELPTLSLPRLGRRKKRDAAPAPVPEPPADRGTPVAEPAPDPEPATAPEHAPATEHAPEPVAVPEPVRPPVAARRAEPVVVEDRTEPEHEPTPAAESEPVNESRSPRQPFRLPSLPPRPAVALTGLLVGVVGVALTYLGLRGCNAVRGTETCGGGPGLLLLVVILVVMVLLGAVVLRLLGLTEAGGTSFLAIGVVVVVSLLALQGVLQSAVMAVVLPVLCVASYLLAHWVTTAFVEPKPEKGPQHDVR